jgi:hypothetical protein
MILEERGIHINENYDKDRKLIDVSQDLHPRDMRRLVQRYNEEKQEQARKLNEEEVSFWERFLQTGGSMSLPTSAPTNAPVAAPTNAPVLTGAPVIPLPEVPTASPVAAVAPTATPVAAEAPTASPVAGNLTDAPTASPVIVAGNLTDAPTASPVIAPVGTLAPAQVAPEVPTASPVAIPTTSPVAAATPTATPVAAPTTSPVAAATPTATPVAAPTASPVATPVAAPTASPVATPVAAPTASPVATPVAAPTAAPIAAPTATPVAAPNRAREVIIPVALFGGTEFNDPESYQSKSLAWLENSALDPYSDTKLIQRYCLGCIYYATYNVSTTYTDTLLGSPGLIFPWNNARAWLTDVDECTWSNVLCDETTSLIIRMDFVSYHFFFWIVAPS